ILPESDPPMQRCLLVILLVGALFAVSLLPNVAQSDGPTKAYNPPINPASDEGLKAIKRIRIPEGLEVTLFAAEPMLANPVCFCFDEKGRLFVAETFRLHQGVTDNRSHMSWLNDDLASRTVEDRVAMYRKHLKDKVDSYGVEHDRIRLIEDTDG